ncbi:MAG TPA: wax ester/triacylglycerol synthase family O-acyltransferase [Acidimicrobiales bacterium]|nr:wax ester/triacylglycerol synthase family O-acyltransferase [Acidimicrobiales bacterium]
MTDAEALMWNLEKDPSLRSTFLNITFLDAPPDFDRFRARLAAAVAEIPRLRQRVVPAPGRIAPPQWTDDPSFDLDYHVRRIALPAPGTDRQLLDWAALHFQDPFDRARPLWEYTVVEGLSGGRAALLAKMHHTITDGVGGVRMSAMFIDLERESPEPAEVTAPPYAERPEAIVESLVDALTHGVRRQLGISRRAAALAADAVIHPERVAHGAGELGEIARSVLRQLVVTDSAHSPLWAGRRSLGRRFEILSIDLDRLKDAAHHLGGTVNDAFVCGVAGGAGTYHRELGVEIDDLRVSVPVSTRADSSAGGNAFTPLRVLVPCGIKDPTERFRAVRERLTATKRERALGLTDTFAALLNALPTSMVVNLARQQTETVDFATSNLRGAPWDLYIAGSHILSNHPMGPTGGTAFNATVLSYRNTLDMGIDIDTAAIDDGDLLRECIASSFDELLG